MSVQTSRECFQSLKTPEAVTIYTIFPVSTPVSLPGKPAVSVDLRQTDDIFWRVFDFSFINGKPYDKAVFDAGQPAAVLTESVARSLFGTTDVAGREFLLSHAPYRVAGVVKDVSTLADCAYGQVWVPYTSTGMDNDTWNDRHMGMMSCTILARSRDDFPAIRREAERRKSAYNTLIGKNGWELIYRNRPYDQEKNAIAFGANIEPDVDAARRQRIIIFVILLIVPAINLSSMTQSLLLSVVFAYVGNTLLFAQEFSQTLNPPEVDASILLHASTFAWALLFCFVLNLMSSGFPAWRASRIGIVNALGGRLH